MTGVAIQRKLDDVKTLVHLIDGPRTNIDYLLSLIVSYSEIYLFLTLFDCI